MSFSGLKKQIYVYLGYHGKTEGDCDELIDECLKELETVSQFRYFYKYFEAVPDFLLKQPYLNYLEGSKGVILSVMTLGSEVDRRFNYLSKTNAAKSVVFDACASALLEQLSDEYESKIDGNLSYRFCPGYGGSDISDIKYIFQQIKPEKTGVILTETNYMIPSKSMAGIIAVGVAKKKSCAGCVLAERCTYIKEGARCYGSEKKC